MLLHLAQPQLRAQLRHLPQGLAPAAKHYDFHVTLAMTSMDCFGAARDECQRCQASNAACSQRTAVWCLCFTRLWHACRVVCFRRSHFICATHAEKQSIVVNGELTPTIEVTRGQVLEVGACLGLRTSLLWVQPAVGVATRLFQHHCFAVTPRWLAGQIPRGSGSQRPCVLPHCAQACLVTLHQG